MQSNYSRAYHQPNYFLIITMWLLPVFAGVVASMSLLVGVLIDLVAIILAVYLICSSSRANRLNGWAMLILEAIVLLVVAYIYYQIHYNPRWIDDYMKDPSLVQRI